jgi:hypothetical protein
VLYYFSCFTLLISHSAHLKITLKDIILPPPNVSLELLRQKPSGYISLGGSVFGRRIEQCIIEKGEE